MEEKHHYIGSVRFYKQLILLIVFLLIFIPSVSTALLWNANLHLQRQLKECDQKGVTQGPSVQMSSSVTGSIVSDAEVMDYQQLYPTLYIKGPAPAITEEEERCVYLTFDDGPSALTGQVLDILAEYDVKATFFVVYQQDEQSLEMYRRIVAEGHTLGIHSASHNYKQIYRSVEAYLEDFARLYDHLYLTTGVKPEVFRFPGGSVNAYNQTIYQELIAEMLRRGFRYFDWNASAQDAAKGVTSASCEQSVRDSVKDRDRAIILFHDSQGHNATVAALPRIIEELRDKGYTFEKLDRTVRPIDFSYSYTD